MNPPQIDLSRGSAVDLGVCHCCQSPRGPGSDYQVTEINLPRITVRLCDRCIEAMTKLSAALASVNAGAVKLKAKEGE